MDLCRKDNGYIKISGFKGLWTLDEVINLLQFCGLKVKISMSTKGDDPLVSGKDSPNLVEDRR